MPMQLCAKCKKRPAVVFITRMEKDKTVNEGLCLICAREMGIKPVEDMLKKMGVSDADIENMSDEMNSLIESTETQEGEDGGAPAVDLSKLFSGMGMPFHPGSKRQREDREKQEGVSSERPAVGRTEKKFLSTYCTDLTAKAAAGRIDRMIGRERELDRVIQILCRRQKNNPCLIGEPGVGKTAIAEALAQRIVDGQVPDRLRECELWLLDLTSLVAGTQFRGQFESRILGLIREVKAAGNIILMIDEVHNIVGAGDSEGSMSAANMLKPALSRGEIQVIGATTLKEYRKYIEKDSALERRFQPVTVNEPSLEDTVAVLRGIKDYYESFHGLHVPDEVARAAARLSERYITDRFLPDKAIDLLDEACARCALACPELNEKKRIARSLAALATRRTELEGLTEKPEGQTEENYKQLADLKVEELNLTDRMQQVAPVADALTLSVNDVAGVIETWTGIPATEITAGELAELNGLHERTSARIIGQQEAVSAVVRAVRRKRAGASYRKSPVSMIFAGPTGVGKTELVKVLADELFKQPEALIRLDMSEYMEKFAVSRIIGAPPGYVGYDEAGQLTEKIRRRPYAVILFDEIEKAHPDVLNILLQILDDGEITDSQGRHVNFENTVIIMTTNAGSESSSAISGFTEQPQQQASRRTEQALSSFLRPEFINRIDEIITFRHLSSADFSAIAVLMLGKLQAHFTERGLRLTYDASLPDWIADGSYSEKYGARSMRRFLEREVEDPIANTLIDRAGEGLIGLHLSLRDGKVVVDSI